MALTIASHSPSLLLLASRTPSRIASVVTQISSLAPSLAVKSITLDLSSQASIRTAAKEILSLTDKLDIIINNAAVNVPDFETTKEGIEMHFGTNQVGLFLLTNLLLPAVLVAASAKGVKKGDTRVVNLSSAGHRLSGIRFSDYNFKKKVEDLPAEERPPPGLPQSLLGEEGSTYSPFIAYGQSKTGNILYSLSLNEALAKRGVVSYAVHPGSIWTGLARNLDEEKQELIRATGKVWKTGDQGAATALVAALDPALSGESKRF